MNQMLDQQLGRGTRVRVRVRARAKVRELTLTLTLTLTRHGRHSQGWHGRAALAPRRRGARRHGLHAAQREVGRQPQHHLTLTPTLTLTLTLNLTLTLTLTLTRQPQHHWRRQES